MTLSFARPSPSRVSLRAASTRPNLAVRASILPVAPVDVTTSGGTGTCAHGLARKTCVIATPIEFEHTVVRSIPMHIVCVLTMVCVLRLS